MMTDNLIPAQVLRVITSGPPWLQPVMSRRPLKRLGRRWMSFPLPGTGKVDTKLSQSNVKSWRRKSGGHRGSDCLFLHFTERSWQKGWEIRKHVAPQGRETEEAAAFISASGVVPSSTETGWLCLTVDSVSYRDNLIRDLFIIKLTWGGFVSCNKALLKKIKSKKRKGLGLSLLRHFFNSSINYDPVSFWWNHLTANLFLQILIYIIYWPNVQLLLTIYKNTVKFFKQIIC